MIKPGHLVQSELPRRRGSHKRDTSAIVLAGGGTRGAYEAGVINYLRTELPPSLTKQLRFDIKVGSSVGAINASFMAAFADDPINQGHAMVQMWNKVQSDRIYRRGAITLSKFLARTTLGSVLNLAGLHRLVARDESRFRFQSIFDTRPFMQFLLQHCPFSKITENMRAGHLAALAVSATNLHSGRIEIFVQTEHHANEPEHHKFNYCRVTHRHIMASAALPGLFPPVVINGTYYNDAGLRMKTPLSPAVSLGATKILVIGVRGELEPSADTLDPQHIPGLGDILGKVFGALFLDRLEADETQLIKINRILFETRKHVSPQAFQDICHRSNASPIELLSINPSIKISELVDEQLRHSYRHRKKLGILERSFLRILEVDVKKGSDFLSYFLFEPSYIKELLSLGFADAKKRHHELLDFAERIIYPVEQS